MGERHSDWNEIRRQLYQSVRLFAKVNSEGVTAYILAEGDGAVIFPQSSSSLFAKLTQVTSITFGNIDTSNVTTMVA